MIILKNNIHITIKNAQTYKRITVSANLERIEMNSILE